MADSNSPGVQYGFKIGNFGAARHPVTTNAGIMVPPAVASSKEFMATISSGLYKRRMKCTDKMNRYNISMSMQSALVSAEIQNKFQRLPRPDIPKLYASSATSAGKSAFVLLIWVVELNLHDGSTVLG